MPLSPSSLVAAVLVALAGPSLSQTGAQPGVRAALDGWRAEHGASWRASFGAGTGHVELLYGGGARGSFRPRPGSADAEWIELAREHVVRTAALHGVDAGTLHAESVRLLPLGIGHGGVDKWTVRFAQSVAGIPVVDGTLNVLMNEEGTLLSVQSTASPFLAGAASAPRLAAGRARRAAQEAFAAEQGGVSTVGDAQLAFRQVLRGELRLPLLSWQVAVRGSAPDGRPLGREYWVDARSGAIVDSRSTVHEFDVGGSVSTMATPGEAPDTATNPEVAVPMAYARVTSSAGTTFTDAAGSFNFPGATGPLNVTFEYRGLYNRVFNDAGAEYSLTVSLAGTGNSVLMNPSPNEILTAQANAYRHVGTVNDFIKASVPGDTTPDFEATSNANLASDCSAYYDGSSINYMTAGSACPNTAYSTVVAHELGHWLNDAYGHGNSSDGIGEGTADIWAMYTFDTPVVGLDLFGPGTLRRTGENLRQFCGDCCPRCHGESHDDGEPWMGAAWKVRANLNGSLGDGLGDTTADALFLGWCHAYDQRELKSIIETQWLTLDDDDADLSNGTPNFVDIDGAFRIQGFPGVDLPSVTFSGVTQLGDTTSESGPYVVDATIVAVASPPVSSATLSYRVDGGSFSSVPMVAAGGDLFRGEIPGQSSPAEVDYYLSASDSAAGTEVYPAGAPGETLRFRVGVVTTFLANDFEGASDDGWTVGDAGDDATTGVWVRVDPRGTAAQPEDDHTPSPGVRAWVTGQGTVGGSVGEEDVDGGKTTLKSVVFDATGTLDPRISYWRWFSNQAGGAPGADVFRVWLSDDAGATWSLVEEVGPTGAEASGGWFRHELAVASILAPTATMQLRFVASDEGDGSIVEAAVDDVLGEDLGPSCKPPHNYCVSTPTSASPGARITWDGSSSIAANDLELVATLCPAGQFGIFFMGATRIQVAFGHGFLCAGGGLTRFNPPILTDAFGEARYALDVSAPPAAGLVVEGSTWNFQFWFRDPPAGGAGFNTTDGLEVVFCE